MIDCVVGSKEINKCSSCYHASLISLLNVLSKIQQLDGPGLNPACSLIMCGSTKGAIIFSSIGSYVWQSSDIGLWFFGIRILAWFQYGYDHRLSPYLRDIVYSEACD